MFSIHRYSECRHLDQLIVEPYKDMVKLHREFLTTSDFYDISRIYDISRMFKYCDLREERTLLDLQVQDKSLLGQGLELFYFGLETLCFDCSDHLTTIFLPDEVKPETGSSNNINRKSLAFT